MTSRDQDDTGKSGTRNAVPGAPAFPDGLQPLRLYLKTGNRLRLSVWVAIFALVLIAWSSVYTVPSDSVAVIQRFGKYINDVPPGLHMMFPLGADAATIVPVKRQLKQEFGFSARGAGDPDQSAAGGAAESIRGTEMVTGDLNAALVERVVQYRVADPTQFLFEVREPSQTLRHVSESVMREGRW